MLGDLPLPPPDFAKAALKLVTPDPIWLRLHHESLGAVFFSKAGRSRWDCGGPFGAMCVGESLDLVVLERFGDQLRANARFLSRSDITTFRVTELELTAAFPVFDIRDAELGVSVNADARLFSGSYRVSRAYSRAFMEHPAGGNGLLYNSRHNPALTNLVLFDRAVPATWVKENRSSPLEEHPDYPGMLRRLRITVAPK